MESLLLLGLLGLGVWFWVDSLHARERAVTAAARACHSANAQLLDETVSLQSIKPARNSHGHLVWRRVYGFEYSLGGVERRSGRAVLRGRLLEQVQLDGDHGTTIEQYNG